MRKRFMGSGGRSAWTFGVAVVLLAMLPGCSAIGPAKVMADRSNYNTSLTESWKRQILLNIVKIRYVEPLFFVDVGDIVAGYTLETGGTFAFTRSVFDMASSSTFSQGELGISGKYTDRPTITYRPMTGTPFRKGVMSPMSLTNVMLSIESGASAEFLFRLGVALHKRPAQRGLFHLWTCSGPACVSPGRGYHFPPAIPERPACARSSPTASRQDSALPAFGVQKSNPGNHRPGRGNSRRCWIWTRPFVNMCWWTARKRKPARKSRCRLIPCCRFWPRLPFVCTSRKKMSRRIAPLPGVTDDSAKGLLGGIAVQSGTMQPDTSFVAVRCRNHWFWVDDHDLATKRVFSFLMLAFTLIDDSRSMPVQVTIPVQ